MIKLITPKRDLYLDGETSNPQGLFGKKGMFYEVEKSPHSQLDIIFTDERGNPHEYSLQFLNKDFWTVDFDKGFEFERYGNSYEFKDGVVMHMGSVVDDVPVPRVMHLIANGLWHITRFSNQTVIPTPTEEPSHPYENWKKDIGIAKFKRCIDKVSVALTTVEGIVGYLDEYNGLFYYHKKHRGQNTYLCCKVDYDYDASSNLVLQFIRDNKDVELIAKSSDTLASFKLPEDKCIADKLAEELALAYKNTFESSVDGEGEVSSAEASVWTDKHYDFSYTLTEEDIEAGEIKIDPYFVSYQWKLGEKDNSGALWHCFKGIARFGEKNPVEREIKALHAQVKRLAEIHKVDLG